MSQLIINFEFMEKQKIVLITGCSSGMGLYISVYLAGKGYKVYASMRDLKKKDNLLSSAKRIGVSIELLQLDVTDAKSIREAVDIIVRKEGRIDVLVNNAGFGSGGFLEDFSMEEIKEQFETNFFGMIRVIQTVLPIMRSKKSGHIINTSSLGGKIAFPAMSIYNASKFAVESLTESLRIELAPFGIKVTAIEPGSVNTNFHKSVHVAKRSQDPSSPYYVYMKRFERNIAKISEKKDKPEIVAKVIYSIIISKNPKRSYPVGNGAAMFLALKKLLPNFIFEKMIGRMLLGQ